MIYDPLPRYFDPQPKRLSLIQRVGRILGKKESRRSCSTPTFNSEDGFMVHRVATFFNPREPHERPKLSRISAYTRMYSMSWKGCIVYEVEAATGNQAKIIARQKRFAHEEFNYR